MGSDDMRAVGRPLTRAVRTLWGTACRRPRQVLALGALLLVCTAGAALSLVFLGASESPRALAAARAREAYAAMQQYFYSASMRTYTSAGPAARKADAWPFSQAMSATATLTALPVIGSEARADLRAQLAMLNGYRAGTKGGAVAYAALFGGNGHLYYDDNLWIALDLVETSDVLADPSLLTTAEGLFALVANQWDSNPSDPCPGGVFWTNAPANHDRNAVTTANAALLALELYQRTHSASYLAFGEKAYAWTARCLRLPDGLIQDHIDLQGRVDPQTWSYNQGAMIAAGVDLFRATGERGYLAQAEQTGLAELNALGDPLTADDAPVFLAIFYRDLEQLEQVDPNAQLRSATDTFADEAWSAARNPSTGLFSFGGAAPTLLDQAAMVQVYGLLASA